MPAAAATLLWPAVWNGYPIVFADTGTYLSQAIHHYAGWDRPVFYSLFMFPLHAMVSVWPVVAVQALLTAWLLQLVCRVIAPALPGWLFLIGVMALSILTWLPWLVSELTPDLFTPLMILCLVLLAWTADLLSMRKRGVVVALCAFMVATQQSSVPLSIGLLAITAIGCYVLRAGRWPRIAFLPPIIAILALCSVNLAAHGRFAVSPYGSVFLLARIVYDGPGTDALRRACPGAGWRLCPFIDRLPVDSDHFLWTEDSPLNRAGGAKVVSSEAGAIIAAAISAEPLQQLGASARNTLEQMDRFASGDGLEPWPAEVAPWIERDFPTAEASRYRAARQQRDALGVPWPFAFLHEAVAILGVAGCLMLLPSAVRGRLPTVGLLIIVLASLPLSAAITGALSAPHDRYQARIMWLPPFAAGLAWVRRRG